MLNKNFREFLRLLIENDVKFLVVGGYAVGVHGFPRYTGDMDVFVALNPDNALRIAAVFNAFGFGSLGISAADFPHEDSIVEIGREPNKIQVCASTRRIGIEWRWNSMVCGFHSSASTTF
jgi:hypothetical protein